MNDADVKICLSTLDELLNRPIMQLFLSKRAIASDSNFGEKKLSFDIIRDKIFDKEYNNINEYTADVNIMFDKFKKVINDPKLELCLTDLISDFDQSVTTATEKNELESFKELHDKLLEALKDPPLKFDQIADRLYSNESDPLFKSLTPQRLEDLSLSIVRSKSLKIQKGVESILKAFVDIDHGQNDKRVHFKINNLPDLCVRLMEKYVKQQFALDGIDYPLEYESDHSNEKRQRAFDFYV